MVKGAFPVRPAGPLHAETALYRIPAGEEVSVPPAKGYPPARGGGSRSPRSRRSS